MTISHLHVEMYICIHVLYVYVCTYVHPHMHACNACFIVMFLLLVMLRYGPLYACFTLCVRRVWGLQMWCMKCASWISD